MIFQNNTKFELVVEDAIDEKSNKIIIQSNDVIEIPNFKCADIYVKDKTFRRLSTKNVLKIEATYEKILKYKKDGEIISNSWGETPLCCTTCFKNCYKKNIDDDLEPLKECNSCKFYITDNNDFYKCICRH